MIKEEVLRKINHTKDTYAKALNLSYYDLEEIPSEIRVLEHLEYLYLNHNKLRSLPVELIYLTNLTTLELSHNQIPRINTSNLWTDTSNPRKLLSLYFEIDEALFYEYRNEPIRIIEQIGRISEEKQKDEHERRLEPLLEGRLIIIGQGNAGKTSIKQRLLNYEYEDKGKTEGVEIDKWDVEINEKIVRINVWDFGGQEIYHTTHQFFFRERCLYLLVVDVRAGMEKIICKYWLRQIKELAGDNAPLILVANKAEVYSTNINNINNDEGIDRAYYSTIEDRISEFREIYKNIKEVHFVSASVPLRITDIRTEIIKAVRTDLPEVFYEYEAEYAITRNLFRQQNKDFIAKEEFQKLISPEDFDEKFKQPEGQKDLVKVLDILGVITHFEGEDLQDLYILKPEWITKGVYKILSSYKLAESKGKPLLIEITEILHKTEYEGNEKYIVQLMKKFSLCFLKTEFGEERLVFPAWLPVEEKSYSPFTHNIIKFKYQYKRDSSIEKFITTFIVDNYAKTEGNTYWRYGVVLRKDNCRALVIADTEKENITITVEGEKIEREKFLKEIKDYFVTLHEKFNNPVENEESSEIELTEIDNPAKEALKILEIQLQSVSSENEKYSKELEKIKKDLPTLSDDEVIKLNIGTRIFELSSNLTRLFEIIIGILIIWISYSMSADIIEQWKNGNFEPVSFIYTVPYILGAAFIFFGVFRSQLSLEWLDGKLINGFGWLIFKAKGENLKEFQEIHSRFEKLRNK